MKTNILKSMSMEKVLIFTLVTVIELVMMPVQAQVYKRNYGSQQSTKTIVSFTTSMSTRGYSLKSDIPYLNGKRIGMQGWESTFSVGGNKIGGRGGYGAYKTQLAEGSTANLSSYSGHANIYLKDNKSAFRPYAITGVSVNAITVQGSFIPDAPKLPTLPQILCPCMMTNPDGADATTFSEPAATTPTNNAGQFTSTQMITGAGAEYNLLKSGGFLALFGEVKYGMPIGTTAQDAVMNHTKSKGNVVMTFGVSVGINSKRKSPLTNRFR